MGADVDFRIDLSCSGDFEPDEDVDGKEVKRLTSDFGRTDCDQDDDGFP